MSERSSHTVGTERNKDNKFTLVPLVPSKWSVIDAIRI